MSEPSGREDLIWFCVRCFASSESGSWGGACDGDFCSNCCGSETFQLPKWAVESIRQQASWIGKRYYPHKEDVEQHEELRALRALVGPNPHDEARRYVWSGEWSVTRKYKDGQERTVCGLGKAKTEQEARERANLLLPYAGKE